MKSSSTSSTPYLRNAHVTDHPAMRIFVALECEGLINSKKIEPNSSFGKAVEYIKTHWEGLTLFLRLPGVPISNNDNERQLKRSVRNRKNAYFYKNEAGAKIGDILMSVLETCALNKINPYKYLIALQENALKVLENPKAWLPWNYEQTPAPG